MSSARLSVLFGPRHGTSREVQRELVIGRGTETDLQLFDEKVSRTHCRIDVKHDALFITDLGSRNGTWLNGARVTAEQTPFGVDDTVSVGDSVIVHEAQMHTVLARLSQATLVLTGGEPSRLTSASAPADDMWAAAGKFLAQLSENPTRDRAAQALLEAISRSLSTTVTSLCERVPSGVLRPWLTRPEAATLSVQQRLVALCVAQGKALSAEVQLPVGEKTDSVTLLTMKRAWALCAPLRDGAETTGVLLALRHTAFESHELALAGLLSSVAAPFLRAASAEADGMNVGAPKVIAYSAAMKQALIEATHVAAAPSTVLLRGASGTGKEALARTIHHTSARAKGPFVAVNCGAIPAELAESTLFGHERGAFTGALQARTGVFEQADGGTLFLDEVGDLPLPLQVKILRVLEDRLVTRVGGNAPFSVDVRLVAATNRDLEAAVRTGTFREDLFWRLNVVSVALKPLRERREDLVPLAEHFLALHAVKLGCPVPTLSVEVLERIENYPWPGNARQLSNAMERALVLRRAPDTITLADLPAEMLAVDSASSNIAASNAPLSVLIERIEREQIVQAMRRCRGVKAQAAEQLGISRPTLDRKLTEYAIDWLPTEPA